MKRIAKPVTASTSQELLKWKATAAKRALEEFVRVAKQYDNINEHVTSFEFTCIDKVLEALDDTALGVYVQYPDEEDLDNHIM